MRKTLALLTSALVLSGCSALVNSERRALTVAERHPITVDQQTVSVVVPVDPTLQGLSRKTLAQLDAFLSTYRARGHGPVTVTAPSGTGRDIDGQHTAADVRQALNALGLDYREMQGSTLRTGQTPSVVIVSFSQYVASGPACGNFGRELLNAASNRPAQNFGCADQHNLAAMISDPKDLVSMQEPTAANGAGLAAASRALTTGQNSWGEGRHGAGLSDE